MVMVASPESCLFAYIKRQRILLFARRSRPSSLLYLGVRVYFLLTIVDCLFAPSLHSTGKSAGPQPLLESKQDIIEQEYQYWTNKLINSDKVQVNSTKTVPEEAEEREEKTKIYSVTRRISTRNGIIEGRILLSTTKNRNTHSLMRSPLRPVN